MEEEEEEEEEKEGLIDKVSKSNKGMVIAAIILSSISLAAAPIILYLLWKVKKNKNFEKEVNK